MPQFVCGTEQWTLSFVRNSDYVQVYGPESVINGGMVRLTDSGQLCSRVLGGPTSFRSADLCRSDIEIYAKVILRSVQK